VLDVIGVDSAGCTPQSREQDRAPRVARDLCGRGFPAVSLGDISGTADGRDRDLRRSRAERVALTGVGATHGWPRSFLLNSSITQPILVPVGGDPGLAVSFGFPTRIGGVTWTSWPDRRAAAPWPKRLLGTASSAPWRNFTNDGLPEFGFSTDTDSMYVSSPCHAARADRYYASPTTVEVFGMVTLTSINGRSSLRCPIGACRRPALQRLTVRSFDRLL